MRRTVVVAILPIVLAFCGMAFAFDNEPEGFRDLNWGDPPAENMQLLGQAGNRCIYFRFDDRLQNAQPPLQAIIYSFYGKPEKLFIVVMYFNGRKNYEEIKAICKARFGEGTEEAADAICWMSPESMVHLIFWHGKGVGELHLVCKPIYQEFTESERKRAG